MDELCNLWIISQRLYKKLEVSERWSCVLQERYAHFFFFNNKNKNKAGAYPGTVVSSEAVEIGRGVEGVL